MLRPSPLFPVTLDPGVCNQSTNRDRCGNSQPSIHSLHRRGPTVAAIFYIIWRKDLVEIQGPEWLVSVAQRWVLRAGSFQLTTVSAAHVIQGANPSLCPSPSTSLWGPHTTAGPSSVAPHPSLFSPQLISLTISVVQEGRR